MDFVLGGSEHLQQHCFPPSRYATCCTTSQRATLGRAPALQLRRCSCAKRGVKWRVLSAQDVGMPCW
eukprot:1781147-Prorocentrum_lima.AAC.2